MHITVYATYLEAMAAVLGHWPFRGLLSKDDPECGIRGVVICKAPIVEKGFAWLEYGQSLTPEEVYLPTAKALEAYILSVPRSTLVSHRRYYPATETAESFFEHGVVSYHRAAEGVAEVRLLPKDTSRDDLSFEVSRWLWDNYHDRDCYAFHVQEHIEEVAARLATPPVQRPYTFGRTADTAHQRLLADR